MSYPTDNDSFVPAEQWNMDFLNEGAAPLPAGMQGELSFPDNANANGLDQQQQLFLSYPYPHPFPMYDPTMPMPGFPMLAPGQMAGFAPGAMPDLVGPMPDFAPGIMPGFAPGMMPGFAPGPMPDLAQMCINPAFLNTAPVGASGSSTPSLGDVSTFTTASSSSLATPAGTDAPAPSLDAVDALLKKVQKTGAARKSKVAGKPLRKSAKAPTKGKERIALAFAHSLSQGEIDAGTDLTCPFESCRWVSDTPALHRRHILSHTQKSFPCDWCGRQLSRPDSVARHKRDNCRFRHDPPTDDASAGESD
ncbi:hypothetical protein AURDEDRAFT_162205 [Auricularia subglabra TFB-10046 SS5]|nr:hypothetical protein AURDEDRAFT_162205 [Auricularia subglabra TFB-10046 SS5]